MIKHVLELWRGQVPLAKTGWLYGLLGILCLAIPLTLITGLGYQQEVPVLMLLLSVAILVYAIFMGIAIWRSASNHKGHLAWKYLAKGSILFIVVYVITGLTIY